MEKTKEKSEDQAAIIKSIAIQIYCLDVDYCREIAIEMKVQADRQESLSVLNSNYPQIKNDLLLLMQQKMPLVIWPTKAITLNTVQDPLKGLFKKKF